ncbi:MAG TPA: hypothetical protein VND19_25120 [Acetobacteraceae bacterium]|nr:hypothetical protein [Acetobacteraceae bacterium]
MMEPVAAIYTPPSPDLPFIAAIIQGERVIFAEPVGTREIGEAKLAHMLRSLIGLAAREGHG